jgi:hypothetical protein
MLTEKGSIPNPESIIDTFLTSTSLFWRRCVKGDGIFTPKAPGHRWMLKIPGNRDPQALVCLDRFKAAENGDLRYILYSAP